MILIKWRNKYYNMFKKRVICIIVSCILIVGCVVALRIWGENIHKNNEWTEPPLEIMEVELNENNCHYSLREERRSC